MKQFASGPSTKNSCTDIENGVVSPGVSKQSRVLVTEVTADARAKHVSEMSHPLKLNKCVPLMPASQYHSSRIIRPFANVVS
jgi:hypothetical protein